MNTKQDLINKVGSYFKEPYEIETTSIIPDTDYPKLTFGNKGLIGELAFLFIDIRESSKLHGVHGYETAAKIYQSFHDICVRIIEHKGGKVRSFDGDRVMGVFSGSSKRTSAIKSAMHIRWAIREILNPNLESGVSIGLGVDCGDTLITKVGKGRDPNNHDLVWVGPACNMASHLSSVGNNSIVIPAVLLDRVQGSVKKYNGKSMWKEEIITIPGKTAIECYVSDWHWSL